MQRECRTPDWSRALLREIGWLLAAKLVALTALWLIAFSPAHRTVTAASTGRHLALEHQAPCPEAHCD